MIFLNIFVPNDDDFDIFIPTDDDGFVPEFRAVAHIWKFTCKHQMQTAEKAER